MSAAYLVTTPNPAYNGKVLGIKFANGKAVVAEQTLSPKLGRTVEQVAISLRDDFGYTVTPLGETPVIPEAAELLADKKKGK